MDLSKLLPIESCLVELDSPGINECLTALAQPLVDSGVVTDLKKFQQDLIEREEQVTTIICDKVAIPHARSSAVTRLSLVVGVHKEDQPCNFTTDETDRPVQLFFLIAIPELMPTSHMPLLKHIALLLKQNRRTQKLLRTTKSKDLHKYLLAFTGK
mgnify:CR=1 FL=1